MKLIATPLDAPKSPRPWIALLVVGAVIGVPSFGMYVGWYDQPPKKCSEATVVGVTDIAAAGSQFMQCAATLVTSTEAMTKLQRRQRGER
jgi:hypothetical protein